MILFTRNVQKRQIYRDRKQVSGCLKLGVGQTINCKWASGNFLEWWKYSQIRGGNSCTVLWYINYISIKLLGKKKPRIANDSNVSILPVLAEASGSFTKFWDLLKLIKNILNRLLKNVLQTYHFSRSCLKFDNEPSWIENHLHPLNSSWTHSGKGGYKSLNPKSITCRPVSLTEQFDISFSP